MDRQILVKKINCFISHHKAFTLLPTEIIAICDLFTEYKQKCSRNGTDLSRKPFCIKVLSYVLERMFWSRFDESRYVGLMLQHAMKTEFEFFAHFIGFCLDGCEWALYGWKSCQSLQNEKSHVLFEYFMCQKLLHRGCRLPLLYPMVTMKPPIEIAVDKLDLPLLQQIMKYGVLLSYPSYPDMFRGFFCRPWSPQRILIELIKRILELNCNVLKIEDLSLTPRRMTKYNKMLCCCNLLLSDIPNWDPAIFNFFRSLKYEVNTFVEVFSDHVVPDLRNHFTHPMELKQACRLSIRKRLNENWMLPHGIGDLAIPTSLKVDLDMHFDGDNTTK